MATILIVLIGMSSSISSAVGGYGVYSKASWATPLSNVYNSLTTKTETVETTETTDTVVAPPPTETTDTVVAPPPTQTPTVVAPPPTQTPTVVAPPPLPQSEDVDQPIDVAPPPPSVPAAYNLQRDKSCGPGAIRGSIEYKDIITAQTACTSDNNCKAVANPDVSKYYKVSGTIAPVNYQYNNCYIKPGTPAYSTTPASSSSPSVRPAPVAPPPVAPVAPPPIVGYTLQSDKSCGPGAIRGSSFKELAAAQTACTNDKNCIAVANPSPTNPYYKISGSVAPVALAGGKCYIKPGTVVTPPPPPKVAVVTPPKVAVVTPPPPPVVISPPPDTVVGYTLNTDKSCGSAAVRGTSFSSFAAAQTVCNNNPNCKAISKPAASTTMYTNFSGTIAPATNQGSRCYVKQ